MMKFNGWRLLLLGMLVTAVVMLFGCGSGGGTGGVSGFSIDPITLSANTIQPGDEISGTVKLKASDGSPLNGVSVSIDTGTNELTVTKNNKTNANGEAFFILKASDSLSPKTVNIQASYKGVNSSFASVALQPDASGVTFKFDITNPPEQKRTVSAGDGAVLYSLVVTGNIIEFIGKDGIDTVDPPTADIRITHINHLFAGESVRVDDELFSTEYPPAAKVKQFVLNAADNKHEFSNTYTMLYPPAPAAGESISNTYVVNWEATVTYKGKKYKRTAVTLVTATTTGK